MPINIKNNGSWSNGTPFVKTSNSWISAKQVFAKVNGTWQTVYTSSISDNFDRANSASLGNVPDTDFTWTQTDGSWSINTNKVESVTSAASYPMIDVDFNTQNVQIGATINATGTSQASGKYGAGIAFWPSVLEERHGVKKCAITRPFPTQNTTTTVSTNTKFGCRPLIFGTHV